MPEGGRPAEHRRYFTTTRTCAVVQQHCSPPPPSPDRRQFLTESAALASIAVGAVQSAGAQTSPEARMTPAPSPNT